jgi:hypothetical protein
MTTVLRQGPVAGSCERGKELSGPMKHEEVIDWQNDYQLLNNYASRS